MPAVNILFLFWMYHRCSLHTMMQLAPAVSHARLRSCDGADLAVMFVARLFVRAQLISWAVNFGEWGGLALNGSMLLLALPLHLVFCKYLWDQQPQPALLLIGLCPLALVAMLVAQTEPIQYLAGSAIVMALLQFFSMSHAKRIGMKVV